MSELIWVLILVSGGGYGATVAIPVAEFPTQELCQKAGKQFKKFYTRCIQATQGLVARQ